MSVSKSGKQLPTISSLKEQERLMDVSSAKGIPFADVLAKAGLDYDSLKYAFNREPASQARKPISLKDFSHGVTVPFVSFFTGCGGMDLGLEAIGWRHVAGFEIQELFCKTLRKNRPHWAVFGPPVHSGDVSRVEEVAEALTDVISTPFEGVFVGGPPCQPFSIAANQRFSKAGDNFKRTGFAHEKNGNLLFNFMDLILRFRPKAFIIENVPGLRDLDGGVQLAAAIKLVEAAGYKVGEPTVYDAADYGVPQFRQRLIVVGSRDGATFVPPVPQAQRIGAGSALTDVQHLPNHETRAHNAESVRRYMRLGYGERDQLGRVDRLDPQLPSKTVIAGGTNGGGRSHLHPDIPRTLSVRECARLQTFPDDYVFVGPTARQFTQVGNAVPPVLAAQIGQAVTASLFADIPAAQAVPA